jgi:leucyl/phenylalanyl-tRNA--protein transferase
LDARLWFPDPQTAPTAPPFAGLVAVGGDLSLPRLLLAYRSGIFPWSVRPITWWSPDPRAVFAWDRFHVPRSLRRVLRQAPFTITRDRAFGDVMAACAEPRPGRRHSWISREFRAAYARLHAAGHAHSLECWRGDCLVGGIYGVSIGGLFAGESMFHRTTDASKVALCHLVEHLRARGFALFDIQMLTPVTAMLGAVTVSRQEYLGRLAQAIPLPREF